jgi:hypothetical protein
LGAISGYSLQVLARFALCGLSVSIRGGGFVVANQCACRALAKVLGLAIIYFIYLGQTLGFAHTIFALPNLQLGSQITGFSIRFYAFVVVFHQQDSALTEIDIQKTAEGEIIQFRITNPKQHLRNHGKAVLHTPANFFVMPIAYPRKSGHVR